MATRSQKQSEPEIEIKYKLKLLVEVEGTISSPRSLRDDPGIEPMVQWAAEDIAQALDGECNVLDVTSISLEKVSKQ